MASFNEKNNYILEKAGCCREEKGALREGFEPARVRENGNSTADTSTINIIIFLRGSTAVFGVLLRFSGCCTVRAALAPSKKDTAALRSALLRFAAPRSRFLRKR
jgi:hypothetical protein